MMQGVSHPGAVKFGLLTPAQKQRLIEARDGGKTEIDKAFDQFMPAKTECTDPGAPDMDPGLVQKLQDAIELQFAVWSLGGVSDSKRKRNRRDLAKLTERLEALPFKVPEALIDSMVAAYQRAQDPDLEPYR